MIAATSEEAAEGLRPFFAGVEVGTGGSAPLRFRLAAHASAGLSLIEYAMSGPKIRADTDSFGFGVAQAKLDGAITSGRSTVDTSVPTLIPDGSGCTITQAHVRALQIDADTITRFVRHDTGDDGFELRFLDTTAITARQAHTWNQVAQFAYDRLRDGSADEPLIGGALTELVIATFLTTFATTWTQERAPRDGAAPISAAVRRARVHIEDNFRLPLTVTEIAAVAHLSVRGMHEAFRREIGSTPLAYLKRVRLAEARRALRAADPADGTTVARISRASGFSHPSRFAAAYRDAFSELPSDTLRR